MYQCQSDFHQKFADQIPNNPQKIPSESHSSIIFLVQQKTWFRKLARNGTMFRIGRMLEDKQLEMLDLVDVPHGIAIAKRGKREKRETQRSTAISRT